MPMMTHPSLRESRCVVHRGSKPRRSPRYTPSCGVFSSYLRPPKTAKPYAWPSTSRSMRGPGGSDALGGERSELEEDRGRVHRGDVVRAVFGRHEADDVAADEIMPAKSLEDARCLRHREAVLAGFEVRYAGCDARVEAVEIEADVEGMVADSLEH